MKKFNFIKKILIISLLLVIYVYVIAIQAIPDSIVIFEGENIGLKTMLGLTANLTEQNKVIETLSNNQTNTINETGKATVKLSLFESICQKCRCRCITKNNSNSSRKCSRNKIIYKWSFSCRNVRNRGNGQQKI